MKRIILLLVVVLALTVACKTQVVAPGPGTFNEPDLSPSGEVETLTFSSLEEYNNFVKDHEGGSNYYGGFGGDVMRMAIEPMMAMDMAVAEGGEAMVKSAPSDGVDFSETNIQVEGVDEADIIKTDGNYIYTVSGTTLFIIKAYPGEDAEIVSTVKLDSRPSGLFIDGDKLAVFGNYNNIDFYRKIDFTPRYGMTYFHIYDINEKDDPELLKEYKFEGNYFNARMTGGHIYFVVRNQPIYRPDYPTPIIVDGVSTREMPVSDIFYYPIPYQNPQLVSIHAVNFDDMDVNSKSIMVEGSQNLYMSTENMYITYTETINEWELQQEITKDLLEPKITDSDRVVIAKIKATDNEVLSQREKEQKILQIYMNYMNYLDPDERDDLEDQAEELLMKKLEEFEHFEFTIINKIAYDNGKISVDENGKVPGHVINQFSMDEFDENFRIATTISGRWSRFDKERSESTNNIYVLDDDMEIIGELEDLAEGERIYSTRFIGDKLYMVTFRQIDPFFVIDLSNPKNPKSLGELKIPGFSRYLHPYDENTIIGIGQDATETGRTKGLKISLFDVSDFENPKEVAKYVTEERYASSTALYEHKAFLFSKEKELLVIPAYSHDWRNDEGYNGAFVFKISKDEIELRGLIDHSRGSENSYGAQVERSLYIEEMLYTKSPSLLRINDLGDLEGVKDIELKSSGGDFKVY